MTPLDVAIAAAFFVVASGIGYIVQRRGKAERAVAFAGDPDFDVDETLLDAEGLLGLRKRGTSRPTLAVASTWSSRKAARPAAIPDRSPP